MRAARVPSLLLIPWVLWAATTCNPPLRKYEDGRTDTDQGGAGEPGAGGRSASSGGRPSSDQSGGQPGTDGDAGETGSGGENEGVGGQEGSGATGNSGQPGNGGDAGSGGESSGGSGAGGTASGGSLAAGGTGGTGETGGTAGSGGTPVGGAGGGTSTPTLTDGLVLHLKLEETVGAELTHVTDSSPAGNDPTVNGSVQITSAGRFGNAAQLDGAGWLSVADNDSLDASDELTLSAWVNFSYLGPNYSHGIISKRAAYGDQTAYTLFLWEGAKIWVDIDLESDRFSSLSTFVTDRWYHVALIFDGSLAPTERVHLYIDGVLDRVAPESSSSISNYTSTLEIGRLVGGGEEMIGRIDEVAIWRRALTLDELAQIAHDEF